MNANALTTWGHIFVERRTIAGVPEVLGDQIDELAVTVVLGNGSEPRASTQQGILPLSNWNAAYQSRNSLYFLRSGRVGGVRRK